MESFDRSTPPAPASIVCIGGGAGPSLLVKTFPEHLDATTAVVTVTDSGSSTGIIRSNFAIAAPGDIRATLSMMGRLSGGDGLLPRLMEYRFQPQDTGQLSNMAFGNLMLAALCKLTGDFARAVDAMEEILHIRGHVLPVSLNNTDLAARLADGSRVVGEVEVRRPGKACIEALYLTDENARVQPEVDRAVREADYVFIGPGNLYTSLLACLVFPGLGEALASSRARRIFICNTTTAPGQTDGYSALAHLQTVLSYLPPGSIDVAVFNTEEPELGRRERYARQGVHFIALTERDLEGVRELDVEPLTGELLEPDAGDRVLHKLDTMRHDPEKLRRVLRSALSM